MELDEAEKAHRDEVVKYSYYIIGLCIAAIAYAINKTADSPLGWQTLPIGLAISSWGLSILSGLNFLNKTIVGMIGALVQKSVIKDLDPNDEAYHTTKMIGDAVTNAFMEKVIEKATFWGKFQRPLFLAGILFFLVWYVWHMYSLIPVLPESMIPPAPMKASPPAGM